MDQTRLLALAAFCALALALPAGADMIQWGYVSSITEVGAVAGADTSRFTVTADAPATGQLLLTYGAKDNGAGSSAILPMSISVQNASGGTNAVTHGAYSLLIDLYDYASRQGARLAFNGQLSGSFTPTSTGLLMNTFATPSQLVTLGGDVYTVTMGDFFRPTSGAAGSIGAHVDVASVSNAPEPSSLLLGAAGLTGGLLGWRRRARRASAG